MSNHKTEGNNKNPTVLPHEILSIIQQRSKNVLKKDILKEVLTKFRSPCHQLEVLASFGKKPIRMVELGDVVSKKPYYEQLKCALIITSVNFKLLNKTKL